MNDEQQNNHKSIQVQKWNGYGFSTKQVFYVIFITYLNSSHPRKHKNKLGNYLLSIYLLELQKWNGHGFFTFDWSLSTVNKARTDIGWVKFLILCSGDLGISISIVGLVSIWGIKGFDLMLGGDCRRGNEMKLGASEGERPKSWINIAKACFMAWHGQWLGKHCALGLIKQAS